jgi:hypothetical protein
LRVGAGISVYVLLMSISGSVIVYHNELSTRFSIEWLVNFHANLASRAGASHRERTNSTAAESYGLLTSGLAGRSV